MMKILVLEYDAVSSANIYRRFVELSGSVFSAQAAKHIDRSFPSWLGC